MLEESRNLSERDGQLFPIRLVRALLLLAIALPFCCLLGDYLWPLPHGNDLSSIYGNWRSRRYHLGIDIRTGGESGRAVIAPEAGYLYRVRCSYYGYGKALYLRMSDGNAAVFAHLSRFPDEIEKYVLQNQLAQESYSQDLFPLEGQFSFARGDTLAWSGSTGVGAPHLHFEIRSPDNVPINPLLLPGLKVPDRRAPELGKLRLVTTLEDELAEALGFPSSFRLRADKGGAAYRLQEQVACGPLPFWLSISAVDRVGRNSWPKAVYSIELRQGDSLIYRRVHDSLTFAANPLIDAYRDFHMASRGEDYFENLFNAGMVADATGICQLVHIEKGPLEVIATDAAGNIGRAVLEFFAPTPAESGYRGMKPDHEKLQEYLTRRGRQIDGFTVAFSPAGDSLMLLLRDDQAVAAAVEIVNLNSDMRRARSLGDNLYLAVAHRLADTAAEVETSGVVLVRRIMQAGTTAPGIPIAKASETTEIECDYRVPRLLESGRLSWSSEDSLLEMTMAAGQESFFAPYRNGYFRIQTIQKKGDLTYRLTPADFAFQKPISYRYRLPPDSQRLVGAALYQVADDGKLSFLGDRIDSTANTLCADSYRLVDVTMRIDTVAPSIRWVSPRDGGRVKTATPQISARMADELSGIEADIEVRVDGVWLVAEYDFESGIVRARPHFPLSPGEHRLNINVSDRLGNQRRYQSSFTYIR